MVKTVVPICWAILPVVALAEAQPAMQTAEPSVAENYWKPKDQLPAGQAAQLPGYCNGAYLKPRFPYPRSIVDSEYPLDAEARAGEYWIDGDVVLTGDVVMSQGNRTLNTERAALDRNSNDVILSDGVRLVEHQVAVRGGSGTINLDTEVASINDVDFLLFDADMRGTARALDRDEQATLTLSRNTFTRCEPGSNSWRISSSTLKVEDGALFATARNAVLRMKGVPIFYTPYIRFPVSDDRQSGFLFPEFGFGGDNGLDLTLPYYLNLAPNYDATVVPRYMADRGMSLGVEGRHLSRWEETTLSGSILPGDDLYNGELSKDDFDDLAAAGLVGGEFNPADRWLYSIDHAGGFGRFRTYVDYTAASDRDYFRDMGSDLETSSMIDVERRGEIRYSRGGLRAQAWVQQFQRLDEIRVDPYERLPELQLSYSGTVLGRVNYSMASQWSSFTRSNADLTGFNAIVGNRLHLEPRLRVEFAQPWGFVSLGGGYRYTEYDLNDVPTEIDAKPDRSIATGSAGAGLFFERELNWFGLPLVHTLEPRVFYLYQEFADQQNLPRFDVSSLTFGYSQLFRNNRFSGLDRIGDANQLSGGITSRFINAESGREYLRASVGEIVYFRDRKVTLAGPPTIDDTHNASALAGELTWSFRRGWRLTGTMVWDPVDNEIDEAAAAVQYRADSRHILNLGYRNRKDSRIDQTDVSLYWPVSRHFGLIGRWNYDIKNGRTIESLGGIEYNDCCWQVRLVAQSFIDNPSAARVEDLEKDEGFFLQVVFKGLAGVGTALESVLQKSVIGYQTETRNGY
jgi:LPS-assembly protein